MPTSLRSETSVDWRSASICACALAVTRAASACAVSRASATIFAPSARALSRIVPASPRASASLAVYSSSAAVALACASSARLMPPSMASRRASSDLFMAGRTFHQKNARTMTNASVPHTRSGSAGTSGLTFSSAAMVTIEVSIQTPWVSEPYYGAGNGMKATAIAMKQRASVSAIPRNIRLLRRPWSSG